MNPMYLTNDPTGNTSGVAGYPETWTLQTITISGLTAPVAKARFAFRYISTDAGLFGGSGGANFPSIVGIDQLTYTHN
jgi:hypothetical protein